jgi:hypothetical protein
MGPAIVVGIVIISTTAVGGGVALFINSRKKEK